MDDDFAVIQPEKKFRKYLVLPSRFSRFALAKKLTSELRILVMAKLEGHRADISKLFEKYDIHEKTGQRAIERILKLGWAESDGRYLFPKSWARMPKLAEGEVGFKRSASKEIRPEYLKTKEKFRAYLLASALYGFLKEKEYIRRLREAALEKPGELGTAFPCGYYVKALGISERTYKRLKALALEFQFLALEPQRFTIVGHSSELSQLRQNMKGIALFRRGQNVVHPEVTPIKIRLL